MLPNKNYFHVTAIVNENKLFRVMSFLEDMKAYNVNAVTVKADYENEEVREKRPGRKRDLTEVKEKIVEYLAKNGPTNASIILKEMGMGRDFGVLSRMAEIKMIKRAKKGVYKV